MEKILFLSGEYACILLTGPRQVGKTTMLRHLNTGKREYVTLDDLEERRLAKRDPALFLQMHSHPILIDEVQYAPEILGSGAINGAILENYVVAEIRKSYYNAAKDCLLWYYRDKNSNEIDMVMEADGLLHLLEIKRTANPAAELVGAFKLLDKGTVPRGIGAIICLRKELSAISAENLIVPVWMI